MLSEKKAQNREKSILAENWNWKEKKLIEVKPILVGREWDDEKIIIGCSTYKQGYCLCCDCIWGHNKKRAREEKKEKPDCLVWEMMFNQFSN